MLCRKIKNKCCILTIIIITLFLFQSTVYATHGGYEGDLPYHGHYTGDIGGGDGINCLTILTAYPGATVAIFITGAVIISAIITFAIVALGVKYSPLDETTQMYKNLENNLSFSLGKSTQDKLNFIPINNKKILFVKKQIHRAIIKDKIYRDYINMQQRMNKCTRLKIIF